jgi:hypothetical protein
MGWISVCRCATEETVVMTVVGARAGSAVQGLVVATEDACVPPIALARSAVLMVVAAVAVTVRRANLVMGRDNA